MHPENADSREIRQRPHEMLEGMDLPNGWKVVQRIDQPKDSTGGSFSCGYIVEHADGRRGYLKAFDFYSGMMNSPDPARVLQPLLESFNFERDLLDKCRERRLSRIVLALEHGAVQVGDAAHPASTVQYIIFELAEGDIRHQLDSVVDFTPSWALRVLHHVAVGLRQLHGIGVAHQDLKPSNVLQFENRTSSKLADLGRAAERGKQPPHYAVDFAGDRGYAPPEYLYGAGSPLSWEQKRLGCDIYHLGSLLCSLFTTVGMTPMIMLGLDPSLYWQNWRGPYEDALVFLRPAFEDAVQYVEGELPSNLRNTLGSVLRQLCDPDPQRRGHPLDRAGMGSPFGLERYISLFNRLAVEALFQITRIP